MVCMCTKQWRMGTELTMKGWGWAEKVVPVQHTSALKRVYMLLTDIFVIYCQCIYSMDILGISHHYY